MILYGVVAGTAIEHLFIGGLVPGLLMIVLVAAYGVWVGVRPRPRGRRFQPAGGAAAPCGRPSGTWGSRRWWWWRWRTGFATVVEAAALAAAYSLVVELLVFRDLQPFARPAPGAAPRRHAGGERAHPARRGAGAHQLVRGRRGADPAGGVDDRPTCSSPRSSC